MASVDVTGDVDPSSDNPKPIPVRPSLNRSISYSDALFSQRIVNMDHYMAVPCSEFDPVTSNNHYNLNENSPRVPVLRIFGATPTGQKTCAHVHGVFPYVTILYDPDIDNFEDRILYGLEKALNEFLKTAIKTGPNNRSYVRRHVFKAVKLCGKTYYGYRHSEEAFLRLYLYNPFVIRKVADLFITGSILGRKYQPYDAHIPYHLQFLIDYNLYGMNLVHYGAVKFRRKPGQVGSISPTSSSSIKSRNSLSSSGVKTVWNLSQIPDSLFSRRLEKIAVSELEIDVCAADIIISSTRSNARSSNPGIDSIWQDEMERRRLLQGDDYSQVSIPESQARESCGEIFSTEALYKRILIDNLSKFSNEDMNPINKLRITEPGNLKDGIPASQAVNHLSSSILMLDNNAQSECDTPPFNIRTDDNDDEEGDELYELFKEFMKEKDDEMFCERDGVALSQGQRNDVQVEEEEDILDPDESDDVEQAEARDEQEWSQSFLSSSVLDSVLREYDQDEDEANNPNDNLILNADDELPFSKNSIFQGDGQDDSDDGDSDTGSLTQGAVRRSVRTRTTPRKYKDTIRHHPKSQQKRDADEVQICSPSTTVTSENRKTLSQSKVPSTSSIRKTELDPTIPPRDIQPTKENKRGLPTDLIDGQQQSYHAMRTSNPNPQVNKKRPGPKSKRKLFTDPELPKPPEDEHPKCTNVVDSLHPSSKKYQQIILNNPVIRIERVDSPPTNCPKSEENKGWVEPCLAPSLFTENPINLDTNLLLDKPPSPQSHIVECDSKEPVGELLERQDEGYFIKSKRNAKRRKRSSQLLRGYHPSSSSLAPIPEQSDKKDNDNEDPKQVSCEKYVVECETESSSVIDTLLSVIDSSVSTKLDDLPIIQPNFEFSAFTDQSSQTDPPCAVPRSRSISVQTEWEICIVHSCDCKSSSDGSQNPSGIKSIKGSPDGVDNRINKPSSSKETSLLILDQDDRNPITDTIISLKTSTRNWPVNPEAPFTPTKLNWKPTRRSPLIVSSVLEGIEEEVKKSPEIRTNQYKTLFKKMLRKNQKSSSLNLVNHSPSSPGSGLESPVSADRITTPRKNVDDEDVSFFQIKRTASRSKSRKRRMNIRAKKLQANFLAPDIFRHEYEPLKFAPSYKRVLKRCKDKQRTDRRRRRELKSKKKNKNKLDEADELSSQENTPQKIRRCNVGGSSEDESGSDCDSPNSRTCLTPTSQALSVDNSNMTPTPKSILRSSKTLGTQSAREMNASGKRKIRWDDGSPKVRKLPKIEQQYSKKKHSKTSKLKSFLNNSELDGPSPKNQFGFEHDMSNLHDAKALHQYQYVNAMSLELHCQSREDFLPDPCHDKILGIFTYVYSDYPENFSIPQKIIKSFLVKDTSLQFRSYSDPNCEYFSTELELLNGFLDFYHKCDPDILVGYEIEKSSWGYLLSRAVILGFDIQSHLSRLYPVERKNGGGYDRPKRDGWDGQIPGRIIFNLWKLLRHEITVQSYTYENAAYHVLHRRVCRFNHATLMQFWNHPSERWRVLEYYADRTKGSIDIINTLDMINRTSELARLFGILFYEVFSRGSQFRVESMMLRITKSQSLIPVSPSVGQRAKMRAPEFLPLILEPQSNYYTDPVAVLDFQSLYPSMMIAYNYDYATVIGRVEHLGREDPFQLGCIENEISPSLLKKLGDAIHISPAGVAFVNSSVRKGVLSEMLEQILDTRQMVKRSMKKWKNEGATLQKILDSRQLGLKLIANVTYGYTSANFSGRMPCVDIADSVVSKGRETLQRAIDFVKSNFDRWGGEVIYGDTDSLFVLFKGKTKAEAFRLGREIAEQVTQLNPKPVKLKFEKIYQPCILQTKKRYVGYSYETEDQMEPIYDAKGIETVRRDGCPAVKKILEKSLHILFTTNDCEKVKNFLQLQFKKLFTGRVSMKDYTFARAYRGREGYKPGACVPSLEIAKKAILLDPRSEPLTKQRVPYVIIYDKPTLPLIKMVRTPMEFANDYTLRLNAHYYIEKAIIPALNRCLGLAKMDVMKWYKSLPRKYLRNILEENKTGQGTLDDFVDHSNCPRCDKKSEKGICINCDNELQKTTSFLVQVSSDLSTKLDTACRICIICSGDDDKCDNTDCPVFHKLLRYERDEHYNKQLLSKLKTYEI